MKVRYQKDGAFVIQCNYKAEEAFQGTISQADERMEDLRAILYENLKRNDTQLTLDDYQDKYIWELYEVDLTAPRDA